jgi:hypothetical protein
VVGNNAALGSGPLTVDPNGGTLQASGTRTVANLINPLGANLTLGGGANDNLTLTSAISNGGFNVVNNGLGSNTLSGIISGTGGVIENAGTPAP